VAVTSATHSSDRSQVAPEEYEPERNTDESKRERDEYPLEHPICHWMGLGSL
jgi:hypothetical protein